MTDALRPGQGPRVFEDEELPEFCLVADNVLCCQVIQLQIV